MGCRNCGKKKEEFKQLVEETKTIQVPKSEPLTIPLDADGNMDLVKHIENTFNNRPTVIAFKKLQEKLVKKEQ